MPAGCSRTAATASGVTGLPGCNSGQGAEALRSEDPAWVQRSPHRCHARHGDDPVAASRDDQLARGRGLEGPPGGPVGLHQDPAKSPATRKAATLSDGYPASLSPSGMQPAAAVTCGTPGTPYVIPDNRPSDGAFCMNRRVNVHVHTDRRAPGHTVPVFLRALTTCEKCVRVHIVDS
jgi:hypothetical protein